MWFFSLGNKSMSYNYDWIILFFFFFSPFSRFLQHCKRAYKYLQDLFVTLLFIHFLVNYSDYMLLLLNQSLYYRVFLLLLHLLYLDAQFDGASVNSKKIFWYNLHIHKTSMLWADWYKFERLMNTDFIYVQVHMRICVLVMDDLAWQLLPELRHSSVDLCRNCSIYFICILGIVNAITFCIPLQVLSVCSQQHTIN